MELVLDIGNSRIKGALFEQDAQADFFIISLQVEELKRLLEGRTIQRTLISSVNESAKTEICALLDSLKISYQLLDLSQTKVSFDFDEPAAIKPDQIAHLYGALMRFPQNDCIVVDISKTATFDLITKEGHYLGGAIFSGPEIIKTPPESALGKTIQMQMQSGAYWGVLGAVERIVSELRQTSQHPSNLKVIATGEALYPTEEQFLKELSDLVDLIDPLLKLVGLHEILKELQYGKS